MDFAGDSLFGLGYRDGVSALFVMDTVTASVTWIPNDTANVTLGINPFNGLQLIFGGFAVHPITGDLWGVESSGNSTAEVIYRIDRTTGAADSIMRLGLNGTPTNFGFDGLEILENGVFMATRGGSGLPNDSVLWQIDVVPDTLGLANVQPIPLTFDPAISGNLNGLQRTSLAPPVVGLSCGSAVRGQAAQCLLAGGVDSVTQWRWIGGTFTSGAGVDTVASPANDTIWAGIVVATGAVEVDFIANGQALSDTAVLFVSPRPWRWNDTVWTYTPGGAPVCTAVGDDGLPFSYNPSGNTHTIDTLLLGRNGPTSPDCINDPFIVVEPNVATQPASGFTLTQVPSGPNENLYYVSAWLYRMDRGSHINKHIGPSGTTVTLQKQNEINLCGRNNVNPPNIVSTYTFNGSCKSASLMPWLDSIEVHESYGDTMLVDSLANGHQRRIEIAAGLPINDPARLVEDKVSPMTPAILVPQIQSLLAGVDQSLFQAADNAHAYVKNNYCVSPWLWDSTSTTPQGRTFNQFPPICG